MVAEVHILLAVQHLQQGGRRISFVIAADLVDLIQKHQRISHARLPDALSDPSRHGAHISLSMAADLCLVMNAAQRNADIFFIQRSGNGLGDGCLSGSRRTHQAENRRLSLSGQRTNRQIIENPLLHLFKTIVILLQNRGSLLQILVIFGSFLPRHLQHSFDIIAHDDTLGSHRRNAFETVDFFADLIFHLFGGVEFLTFFQILVGIGGDVLLAQLLADHLLLFPQKIIFLILIYIFLDFLRDLVADVADLRLLHQYVHEHLRLADHVGLLQKLLFSLKIKRELGRKLIHERKQLALVDGSLNLIGKKARILINELAQQIADQPETCLLIIFSFRKIHGIDALHNNPRARIHILIIENLRAANALHEYPQDSLSCFHHLLDSCDGSNLKQVFLRRGLLRRISLVY